VLVCAAAAASALLQCHVPAGSPALAAGPGRSALSGQRQRQNATQRTESALSAALPGRSAGPWTGTVRGPAPSAGREDC